MIEVTGNLWTYQPNGKPPDVICITTNGTIKKNGECVMGRGCAAEAAARDKTLPAMLGHHLKMNGNVVGMIGVIAGTPILSFPVKHNWWEKADLDLIQRSAQQTVHWENQQDLPTTILLPRPGCGNGNLQWSDVKKVLEPILDDRFYIISFR